REANSRFGCSAKRTLQIAQALYERHKAITYPRTDSRALPEDYIPTVRSTLAKIENPFARKVLDNNWVKPNKRIFNNAKVSDHFAIVPTGTVPRSLDNHERALFDMVTKRFVAVFFPPAQYENTTRITRVEGEPFETEGHPNNHAFKECGAGIDQPGTNRRMGVSLARNRASQAYARRVHAGHSRAYERHRRQGQTFSPRRTHARHRAVRTMSEVRFP